MAIEKNIDDFASPAELPATLEQAHVWQKANYEWWQNHPMRYDWGETVSAEEFSKEFYSEIDKRFFVNAREYLSLSSKIPFNEFIDFKTLGQKDVLEIGVGNGSHAQLLASGAKSFTGIDITDYAVKSTNERFKLFGTPGVIKKMDAEKMDFPSNSFDFVWSWGVIHHSSNTKKILEEINRVLRPGGSAVIMVYHRGWWNYYVIGMLRGIFFGNLFKMGLSRSVQLHTDGAIARYYSLGSWKKLVGEFFKVEKIESRGPKSDAIPLPGGRVKNFIRSIMPIFLNLFLVKNIRMGSFLVSKLSPIKK